MVNKKYIGSTTYVSDASRLTDTYGYNGDVAYVIDEFTKKILSVHTKFNGHWIEVQTDSGGGEVGDKYYTKSEIDTGWYNREQIDQLITKLYKPAGSATIETLPLLTVSIVGNVYNMTESFETTSDFVEGAGKTYGVGTNVVVIDLGDYTTVTPEGTEDPSVESWYEIKNGVYVPSQDTEVKADKTYYSYNPIPKFDILPGFVDLSGYQTKIQVTELPPASEDELGNIYQYIGVTENGLVKGFFYICQEIVDSDPTEYEWALKPVQDMSDVYTFVTQGLSDKVDKVSGKELSTNDYTNIDKASVATIDDRYPKAWDVELTQAEYDALPNTKYVDGKNYYITDGDPDKPIIYGFHIDPDESDPFDAVSYLMDAVGMEPAKMGTTAFNYGSWKNAFFMPKPCMLKYDGTVDYYLDPNDFAKKVDGTPSDIANVNYNGNAMMEFPKIWFKFEAGTADGEGYFYVSNQKVDNSYKCWCNMDADGNEIDHFYMAIYNGTMPNGLSDKMRSLSGLRLTPTIDGFAPYDNTKTYNVGALCKVDSTAYQCITAVTTEEEFDAEKWQEITPNNAGYTTGQQEIDAAVANDTTAKSEWYIETWCDRVLITALLYLIGKSLNLQSTFGRGIDSGSQTAAEAYVTGAANDKGLFYGSTSNGNTVVKVFGIENFWACKWHRTAGLIGNSSGGYSYKMTASTADGSSVSGYNSNGNGYLTTTFNRPTNNYVRLMEFGAHGALPLDTTSATSTTYYCNYFYTGTGFALVGGHSHNGAYCGFCVNLDAACGSRHWGFAAALSCKPLAQKG